jgi:hypothetical protein
MNPAPTTTIVAIDAVSGTGAVRIIEVASYGSKTQ